MQIGSYRVLFVRWNLRTALNVGRCIHFLAEKHQMKTSALMCVKCKLIKVLVLVNFLGRSRVLISSCTQKDQNSFFIVRSVRY